MARGVWVALGLYCVACTSSRDAGPPPESAALPPGVAARVGTEDGSVAMVQRISSAQNLSLPEARRRAVSDAVFAEHAKQKFAGAGLLESAERGALARAMLERLRREAESRGPPTDAEVDAITSERWLEL